MGPASVVVGVIFAAKNDYPRQAACATLRDMHKKVLVSLFSISLAAMAAGCDDDEPLAPKDGAAADTIVPADTAKPDTVSPSADAPIDMPKADATTTPDATADTTTPKPDAGPDATVDVGVPHIDAGDGGADTSPDATVDTAADATVDTAPDGATADTAPLLINMCTTFQDGSPSMSDRYIPWGTPGTFLTGVAERCLQIKVGQAVTFQGDFTAHPLAAEGGDAPAIPGKTSSTGMEDYEVTFNTVGTFGFKCTVHPTQMMGAIHVVP
jgi:hypothetical protein